jgi:hypothetical protein
MEQKKSGFLSFLLTMVPIILIAVWLFVALPDGDLWWFLPVFDEKAAEIHLYRDGQEIVLRPGDEGYDEVNAAINGSLKGIKAKLSRAISEESQQDFYAKYTAVEIFYDDPVIIHSYHSFRKCDKLLIPLSGRHYDPPMVFGGTNLMDTYRAGALVMKDRGKLDEVVESIWAEHQIQVTR